MQDKPAHRHDGADIGDAFDTSSVLSDASDVSALVETEKPPRQAGCQAYEGLKTVEKLDVRGCSNFASFRTNRPLFFCLASVLLERVTPGAGDTNHFVALGETHFPGAPVTGGGSGAARARSSGEEKD